MNCKPGDIAVVVRGRSSLGRFVEVIRLLGHGSVFYDGHVWSDGSGPIWLIRSLSSPIQTNHGIRLSEGGMADSRLRPLRPDELPEQVSETATAPEKSPVTSE